MTQIVIVEDFSRFPAGRYDPKDGNATGEKFRRDFLVPALAKPDEVIGIVLDGAAGYPSSFLDEAFAGLVRLGYDSIELRKRLDISTSEQSKEHYIDEIWDYIDSEAAGKSN